MGSWGTRLYDSDTACDVRDRFNELMQKTQQSEAIEDTILQEFSDYLTDEEDAPIIWIALADMQWRHGILSSKVKNAAMENLNGIIQNLQSGGKRAEEYTTINLIEARRIYKKITSPMGIAKKVSIRRTYQCQWRIGDMYAYKLKSEHAEAVGLIDEFYIYHVVNHLKWSEDIYPVAYCYLTSGGDLPQDMRDIRKMLLIPSMIPPRPGLPISMSEHTKNGDYIYRVALAIRSKAEEKRAFEYLGNYDDLPCPENEYIYGDPQNTIQSTVQRLEVPLGYNWMIDYLRKHNINQ